MLEKFKARARSPIPNWKNAAPNTTPSPARATSSRAERAAEAARNAEEERRRRRRKTNRPPRAAEEAELAGQIPEE